MILYYRQSYRRFKKNSALLCKTTTIENFEVQWSNQIYYTYSLLCTSFGIFIKLFINIQQLQLNRMQWIEIYHWDLTIFDIIIYMQIYTFKQCVIITIVQFSYFCIHSLNVLRVRNPCILFFFFFCFPYFAN